MERQFINVLIKKEMKKNNFNMSFLSKKIGVSRSVVSRALKMLHLKDDKVRLKILKFFGYTVEKIEEFKIIDIDQTELN